MRTLFRPRLGDRHRLTHRSPGFADQLNRALSTWRAVWQTRRQRRALMALDDRMLSDIGLSRSQAYRESSKPFLDVPRDHL
jgi:uncharacterized protein YjiS (DUF1127 family)